MNNCLMILYVALVADQQGWRASRAKVVSELPGVQRRGWRVWPIVQLVNLSVVPLEVRLVTGGFLALTWHQRLPTKCFPILQSPLRQSSEHERSLLLDHPQCPAHALPPPLPSSCSCAC